MNDWDLWYSASGSSPRLRTANDHENSFCFHVLNVSLDVHYYFLRHPLSSLIAASMFLRIRMAIWERRMSVEDKSSRFYVLFLSPDLNTRFLNLPFTFVLSSRIRTVVFTSSRVTTTVFLTALGEYIVCPTRNFIMIPSVRKNVGTGDRGSDSGVQVEEVFEARSPPLLVVYSTLSFAVLQSLSVLRSSSGLRFPRIVQILSHTQDVFANLSVPVQLCRHAYLHPPSASECWTIHTPAFHIVC
jgi:hypothetical protein